MAVRVALVAAVALVLAGTAHARTKTAHLGPIRAEVSWQSGPAFQAKNVLLRVWRDGRLTLTRRLGPSRPEVLKIRDLDGNGEAEVVADFYTGGAHCCLFSKIYGWTGSTYVSLRHMWGDQGYRLSDLNHDGRLELVSADDRFAYVFTAYAGSAFPTQVWDYSAGRMTNVTRSYPTLTRRDAAALWKAYIAQRNTEYADPRGILAAWLADKYLLAQRGAGWKTMEALNRKGAFNGFEGDDIWAKGWDYLAKLKKFLHRTEYARQK
jgi:hypothetical protein